MRITALLVQQSVNMESMLCESMIAMSMSVTAFRCAGTGGHRIMFRRQMLRTQFASI